MSQSKISEQVKFLAEMVFKNEDSSYSMQQDFCFDEELGLEADLRHFCRQHGVSSNVISEHGPAGGWPVVEFTGTATAIGDTLLQFDSEGAAGHDEATRQSLYALIKEQR